MATTGMASTASPKDQAVGDLELITFFYFLRVGEYTQKYKRAKTHTIQFHFCDVVFKKGNTILPRNASRGKLLTATSATMRLSNQKNSIRGAMIHRSAMEGVFFLVKALVWRFLHLRDNDAKQDTIISSYWDHLGKGSITDVDTRVTVRRAVILLHLEKTKYQLTE